MAIELNYDYLINNEMRHLQLLLLMGFSLNLLGQTSDSINKAVIDAGIYGHWPELCPPQISPNGEYIVYRVRQLCEQTVSDPDDFVIQATKSSWRKEFKGVRACFFSDDDRHVCFQEGSSLHFVQLGKNVPDKVIAIRSFNYPGRGNYLSYEKQDGNAVLLNLLDNKELSLGNMPAPGIVNEGKGLLILKTDSSNTILEYMDIGARKHCILWEGDKSGLAGNFDFDNRGQMTFAVTEKYDDHNITSIWHYHFGEQKARLLIKDGDPRIRTGLIISGVPQLSGNGRWVFFTLFKKAQANLIQVPDPAAVNVDVWSYKDRFLQPVQIEKEHDGTTEIAAVIRTDGKYLCEIEQQMVLPSNQLPGDYVVVSTPDSSVKPLLGTFERFTYPRNYYVVSLEDGSKKLLKKDAYNLLRDLSFSPEGKWLVYFENRNYYSYNIISGRLYNITSKLHENFTSDDTEYANQGPVDAIAGWVESDTSVMVYDNYDLWALNIRGSRPAINITGNYGKINHVKFRIVEQKELQEIPTFSNGDTLLLTGFNMDNKYNGFFSKIMDMKGAPQLLYMGPYSFYLTPSQSKDNFASDVQIAPQKASSADCWVVQRQSAKEAPNYFITHNFKTYEQLTSFAPQSKYNWLTAELITWKQLDGKISQGILYKPENVDVSKKYPIIFNFYELLSNRLYQFPYPGFSLDDINIPWFVSRGYLVFTPDIHNETASLSGKTVGWWAYNSVVSAAKYLSELPYVDARRMGFQGHSFGGLEANYLLSHTHLFAAGCEAAGVSDAISTYLTLIPPDDHDQQYDTENMQYKFGATPWQRPDLYFQASAVLDADKITTPLLIMHNKMDAAVQWSQGIELYMALRRLDKPVWMLQYDKGYHSIIGKDALDYTIRMTQFFDYYLKGLPPPVWMTRGVPARLKGITTGFQIDTSGAKP